LVKQTKIFMQALLEVILKLFMQLLFTNISVL
jgi:hypothetical protein